MSLEEWADLHGEDYPKGKFFSALDYGRGDRTCITIYCDCCNQPFEIKEDELDDWIVTDPSDGDKYVMCGECESRRTPRALDGGESAAQVAESTPEVLSSSLADPISPHRQ